VEHGRIDGVAKGLIPDFVNAEISSAQGLARHPIPVVAVLEDPVVANRMTRLNLQLGGDMPPERGFVLTVDWAFGADNTPGRIEYDGLQTDPELEIPPRAEFFYERPPYLTKPTKPIQISAILENEPSLNFFEQVADPIRFEPADDQIVATDRLEKEHELVAYINVEAKVIDVDRLGGDRRTEVLENVKKVNERMSFPTLVVGEDVVVGDKSDRIKSILAKNNLR
jgi:glutaredoxin-like protein NrdH